MDCQETPASRKAARLIVVFLTDYLQAIIRTMDAKNAHPIYILIYNISSSLALAIHPAWENDQDQT